MGEPGIVVLGIDPGPSAHGWALLRVLDLQTAEWLALGVDKPDWYDALTLASFAVRPELVAIERPAGGGYSPATVPPLLETAYQAGILAGRALAAGLDVSPLCAADWRREVVGRGNAEDAAIKDAVLRLVTGWPKKSNAHHRDAAGVALAAGWAWLRLRRAGL